MTGENWQMAVGDPGDEPLGRSLNCRDRTASMVSLLKTLLDRSYENWRTKTRYGFESLDTTAWQATIDADDLVEAAGDCAGAGYVRISKGLSIGRSTKTETELLSMFCIEPPFRVGVGLTLSQRLANQTFAIEVVGVDENDNVVNIAASWIPVAISSIQQATTTLTVTTATAHGLVPGDHVNIYGVSDSRFNYSELIVATVTSSVQFTATATTAAAIASVTAGPYATGYVIKDDLANGAKNAFGLYFVGTSASQLKTGGRAAGAAFHETALTSFGTSCTTATIGNSGAFCDSLLPAYAFEIKMKQEGILARSFPLDALTAGSGNLKKSRVVPDVEIRYKVRIRAVNQDDITRPIAKILSVSKSGSTTATVTCDRAHGLTTGDYVQIYGIRDQTNFANATTAAVVASVVSSTVFTVVFGASATGTSYGGTVIRQTGSAAIGAIAQVAQSIARSGNLLTITGNTTWAGVAVADMVQLVGFVDSSNTDLGLDGAYRVASVSTTSLVLYSTGADFTSVNCGGAVIKRTNLCIHFLRVHDYSRLIVDIDAGVGQSIDIQESVPTSIASSVTIPVTATGVAGAVAHDAAISGYPVRLGARALNANYTAVSTGDTADLISSLVGALIVRANSIPEQSVNASISVSNTSDNALFASQGAGIRTYITSMQIQNTGASATQFSLKDGSTAKLVVSLPASMAQPLVLMFQDPILMTAATAVNVACDSASTVLVNAQGYKAP